MESNGVTTSTMLVRLGDLANEKAWERFVERFRRPIVDSARSLGLPPAEAEDSTQATLLAFPSAYRAGRFDPGAGRLSRWLSGIAFREAQRVRPDRARAESVT